MKKHIVFGGFDFPVQHEMDADAILRGVDYFVDNDPQLIGTTYLGKPIKSPSALLGEDRDGIIILVGSIVYRTEISLQLADMGFEEDRHFVWGISFCGDASCPRLWPHIEWSDHDRNRDSIASVEQGEFALARLKLCARLVDFNSYDTVIDLGAANERIRPFLPSSVRYIPVDYVKYSDDTVLCDMTKKEFPQAGAMRYSPERTAIISSGHIQCATDWRWYLDKCAENCGQLILAKLDFARMTRDYRMTHWSNNHAADNIEYVIYLQSLGFRLKEAYDFRLKSTVYKFDRE
jgi:hypothetical protein